MYTEIACSFVEDVSWSQSLPDIMPKKLFADVWCINVADQAYNLSQSSYILSIEEFEKAETFYHAEDKHRFILSRLAVKQLLSLYTGKETSKLKIVKRAKGKPVLDDNSLHFNISHSYNTILIVIGNAEVGADVELIQPDFEFEDVMTRCFCESEKELVNRNKNMAETFFTLWTRKEALVKATGTGISERLADICCLNGINTTAVEAVASTSNWMIKSFCMQPDYMCSVACKDRSVFRFFNYDSCFSKYS